MKDRSIERQGRLRKFFHAFKAKVHAKKISFTIYVIMGFFTSGMLVYTLFTGQFASAFTALLSLILFLLPTFVEESFRIKLPMALEIIAIFFVFCANILGEIAAFYTLFPFWDDMLHYTSGFIFAAFGFALVDILNRNRNVDFHLSPIFLSLVALCFSVTVGVLWEFFEFAADTVLRTDMQKDYLVTHIYSAELNTIGQDPVRIRDVVQTVITTANGEIYTVDGYLDIGLLDTMKDLFVDFAGAFLFAIIGYFYSSSGSTKGKIAKQFVPRVTGDGSAEVLHEHSD